jgi:hypothetical protein
MYSMLVVQNALGNTVCRVYYTLEMVTSFTYHDPYT